MPNCCQTAVAKQTRPSTEALAKVWADSTWSCPTDRTPAEVVAVAVPVPELQAVLVHAEPNDGPVKSSNKALASCTSPPEVLVTVVPLSEPAPKSAAVVCCQVLGAVTGTGAGAAAVVAVARLESAEAPAALTARTQYEYWV